MQPTPTPLARIYQEHREDLRKKLAREGVCEPDVDDVIHQMFSELHRDLVDNADEPRDLVAWVYAAAHYKAVDYVRYHHLRAALYAPGDVDELLENVAGGAPRLPWLSDMEAASGDRWVPQETGSGVPAEWRGSLAFASLGDMRAPEWDASSNPSARWRGALRHVLLFLSGAVVGAAVFWALLYTLGLVEPPGRRRADETRGSLGMVDPSEARSKDVTPDASLTAPAPLSLGWTRSGAS